jgi:FkbM family methyltransferase
MHAQFFNPPIEENFLGHQMAEVYRDKVYAPYVEGRKDLVILDIGANIGVTSYYFSRYAKKVIALEPALEHFAVLVEMLRFNKTKNVVPINKALYMEEKELPLFHKEKNKTMYSLHGAISDGSPPEVVKCITIDKLMKENKIGEVDLMKLDIEGSENEVLSHPTFKKVAPKIKTIIVERHEWSGRHPNQLAEALKLRDYQVKEIENQADLLVASR